MDQQHQEEDEVGLQHHEDDEGGHRSEDLESTHSQLEVCTDPPVN
jgi:hypothetical protein